MTLIVPTAPPILDIAPGMDGYRIGWRYADGGFVEIATFATATAALRAQAAAHDATEALTRLAQRKEA